MKIILSKLQWETIGQKTGWIKKAINQPVNQDQDQYQIERKGLNEKIVRMLTKIRYLIPNIGDLKKLYLKAKESNNKNDTQKYKKALTIQKIELKKTIKNFKLFKSMLDSEDPDYNEQSKGIGETEIFNALNVAKELDEFIAEEIEQNETPIRKFEPEAFPKDYYDIIDELENQRPQEAPRIDSGWKNFYNNL